MNGLTFGQYIPMNSLVHRLDPRTKLLNVVVLMIAILAAVHPVALALITLYLGFLILIARVPFRVYWQGVKPLFFLIVLSAGFQLFFVPGHPVWQWRFLTITAEGTTLAALMTYRLIYLFLVAQWLTLTTSPLALTDGIEKLLKPFERFGMPAHELAMIMSIALRFIPVLYEEGEKIAKAQMSRGANFGGGVVNGLRNMVAILVPLFLRAFRRAEDLAMAMEARCYTGGKGRTRLKEIRFGRIDYAVLAAGMVMLGLSFMGV
ncbi:MAG: energy-coupling factor transporter transmembrane component T family protein [Solirubrobacterales bacterium]